MNHIKVEVCYIKKNFFNVPFSQVLTLGARLEANFNILERVG